MGSPVVKKSCFLKILFSSCCMHSSFNLTLACTNLHASIDFFERLLETCGLFASLLYLTHKNYTPALELVCEQI